MALPNPIRPKKNPVKLLAQTPSGGFGLGKLLPSQAQFVFSKLSRVAYVGSWGSGKSVALCIRMLVRMAMTDYNKGFMGRLHASDLRVTTQSIWEEVVPSGWIKRANRNEGLYTLRNGSQVLFGHLHDPVKGRQHLASLNVAEICIDQAEEITEDDYIKLTSRARYRADISHSVALAANPAGHNWIWRRFFKDAEVYHGHPKFKDWEWLYLKERVDEATKTVAQSAGIAVPIMENSPELGGYLPKDYIPQLRAELPPEYAARYLDCSFEDFEGKVYPAYSYDGIHNIEYIELDPNWSYFVGIDVGGAAPWALVRVAVDYLGRAIVYDELYKPNLSMKEVNAWICQDPHWHKATCIIDPENRPVATELQRMNPYLAVRPARKHKMANISRVNSYMQRYNMRHISGLVIPGGSPRLYFTYNCVHTRKEHDERLWKPSLHGESRPDDHNDHTCDAVEYVIEAVWAPTQPEDTKKLMMLRKSDPASAAFWDAIHKKEGRMQGDDTASELFEALKTDRYDDADDFAEDEPGDGVWGGEL